MITKKQFDILECLSDLGTAMEEKEMSVVLGMPLKMLDRELSNLRDQGCVENMKITRKGLEALEPFRVERMIVIAAGFGSRLVPITLSTPKPLVRAMSLR